MMNSKILGPKNVKKSPFYVQKNYENEIENLKISPIKKIEKKLPKGSSRGVPEGDRPT